MSKLIVIVGITGVQGGSVAKAFLQDPTYKIRGITRDPTSSSSQSLIAQGIELVKGDVDDISTLIPAFKGANIIFGNTAFSSAANAGGPAQLASYNLEVQQGKNIVDAVASTLDTLELFIWSTLSHASKWSKGKYTKVYHFDTKAAVVSYLEEKHPEVWKKTSLLEMGIFATNWKWGRFAVPWEKKPDGSFLLRIPGNGDFPIPIVVPTDAGEFAYALSKVEPGKHLLAFGDLLTWEEYVKLWSKITGHPAKFEKATVEEHGKLLPGGFGEELGEMFAYAMDFGYWGGDPSVVYPKDLGVDIKVTSIEGYIKNEDWSELLNRPVPE